ncbi:MAG: hypothetical protein IJ595_06925 [Oscillospiraceae bacterium]|nr:hypothetical protein [Oscillospiraceae bacterium]
MTGFMNTRKQKVHKKYTFCNILRRSAAGLAAGAVMLAGVPFAGVQAADQQDFSILGAVGTLTAAQTAEAAQMIYDGLAKHASSVKIRNMKNRIPADTDSIQSLQNVYVAVINGWDVGMLANKHSMRYSVMGDGGHGYVYELGLGYIVDDADYDTEMSETKAAVDAIAAKVNPEWSDVEKALFLHEYLAIHFDYDHDYNNYETENGKEASYTPYGMIERGMGVCEAYTSLYSILLRKVGVESMSVNTTALRHTWNLVQIDGKWYHVDVTWDDANDGHAGTVSHDSFLTDASGMTASNHNSTDWVTSTGESAMTIASSDLKGGFWCDSDVAISPYQEGWITIVQDAVNKNTGWFYYDVYSPTTNLVTRRALNSLDARWPASEKTGAYYLYNYIIASTDADIIYYTTCDAVFALCNGGIYWLFNLTDEQRANGYIYGMYTDTDDNAMYIDVSTGYATASTRYTYDLSELRAMVCQQSGYEYPTSEIETSTESTETETSTESTETETSTESTETETSTESTETETSTESTETETSTESTETETSTECTETETSTESTETETSTESTETETSTESTETETSTESTETETSTESTETGTSTESTETETTTESTETETTTDSTETETSTESTETETSTTETTAPPEVKGDLLGDGELTVKDVIFMTRFLCAQEELTQEQAARADVYQDGIIDIFDLAVLKYLLMHAAQ